ncbi:hypothetical protein ROZALSC1DRAFT_28543 [Rozella allomycis CSF55]|uniref:Uncharacterized protein n=1 Tax=Rozella allomycis (strain CSF55) TaxID=988480 RepID=A0A075AVW2_ROZAC|nr:hypothetical protein O9G_003010 [Rozella allomycis CSF55]RKP19906.1 hypothetical protein ROZALSC1DRAFT_28543 [Rozella allomycis CSF55]|eukprot:EPZ34290.1 hypothetical protein O9G_003010 [Rozella allomycis CSF55]
MQLIRSIGKRFYTVPLPPLPPPGSKKTRPNWKESRDQRIAMMHEIGAKRSVRWQKILEVAGYEATYDPTPDLEKAETGTDISFIIKRINNQQNLNFRIWDTQMRQVLSKDVKGPIYLGGYKPFLSNRLFQPVKPLSHEFRDQLYEEYKSDPENNTPKALSLKYKIEVARVWGIIKLKELEETDSKNGHKLWTEHAAHMDNCLDAGSPAARAYEKPERTIYGAPKFILVENEGDITPAVAGKYLNKVKKSVVPQKPLYMIDFKNDDEDKNVLFIRKDKFEVNTNRNTFVFVDIGKNIDPKDRLILMREPDGVLRHATRKERIWAASKVWKENTRLYVQ